jgi:dynein heavy chain
MACFVVSACVLGIDGYSYLGFLFLQLQVVLAELVDICVKIHESVVDLSGKYFQEMRRHNYISPTSYLYFIETFKHLLISKKSEAANLKQRYRMGVDALLGTATKVKEMHATLKALQPQLISTSQETEAIMKNIEKQRAEADIARTQIKQEEIQVEKNATEARKISQLCEKDLQSVLPVFEEAQRALKILNKNVCKLTTTINRKIEIEIYRYK